MAKEIDEKKIQEMVARGMPQPMVVTHTVKESQPEVSEEEGEEFEQEQPKQRITKRAAEEYRAKYLVSTDLVDRQMLYIDGDLHEQIIDILHVTTKRKVNVSSYVMNVIRGHFDEKRELINSMYNKRLRSPL